MAGTIRYQDDFIVGASPGSRLAPSFRAREFFDRNGAIYIHRELVASIQILRDRLGTPIKIQTTRPKKAFGQATPGTSVVVNAAAIDTLVRLANAAQREGYFTRVSRDGDVIYLEIPDPSDLPSISAETAFDCGVQVTAAFETVGDPYLQVTGNFDGAGLSFGPIQCNLKSGTLQEVFRRMRGEDPARLRRCFDNEEDYRTFWAVLDGSRTKAIIWADGLSIGNGKYRFAQPWTGYLQEVGQEAVFRRTMLRYAYDKYGKLLLSALAFLEGISPVRITNLRCLAALYDMGVQQGSLAMAYDSIRKRVRLGEPDDEFALTHIVVEERAMKAASRWRADCYSRRLSILEREPVAVKRDGRRSRRTNPRLYLLRNSPVRGIGRYLAK